MEPPVRLSLPVPPSNDATSPDVVLVELLVVITTAPVAAEASTVKAPMPLVTVVIVNAPEPVCVTFTASLAVNVVMVKAAEPLILIVVSSVTVAKVMVFVPDPLLVMERSSPAVIEACVDAVELDMLKVTVSPLKAVEPTTPSPDSVPVMFP